MISNSKLSKAEKSTLKAFKKEYNVLEVSNSWNILGETMDREHTHVFYTSGAVTFFIAMPLIGTNFKVTWAVCSVNESKNRRKVGQYVAMERFWNDQMLPVNFDCDFDELATQITGGNY